MDEVQDMMIRMAEVCPHLWRSLTMKSTSIPQPGDPQQTQSPPNFGVNVESAALKKNLKTEFVVKTMPEITRILFST